MRIDEAIYSFFVKTLFKSKYKFEVSYLDFDPKRLDAYIMIGNHPCMSDGIFTSTYLKKSIVPVINAFMFVNPFMKFALTKLYPSIPKRKGQSDIVTVKNMMRVLKSGKGILLYPEGNASFFGEGSKIPFSTVKLLKKMKKDIVISKINGGYLSAARWGDKSTKNGLFELTFYTLFKGEDLKNYSLEEIYKKLSEALAFNDYDWNRTRKYHYHPKQRALGLERFIYYCPKCKSIQTIYTKGNDIYCKNCGKIAEFNEYCLLEGLDFDNLVDWSKLQKQELPIISKNKLVTCGKMYSIDTVKYKSKKIGYVEIKLINDILNVVRGKNKYSFDLDKIKGLTLTRKDEVSFDYEDKTYLIRMKDPMLFYEVIKYKYGG